MDNQHQIWDDPETKRRLTRIALSILGSRVLADEIVQDAYVRLLESDVRAVDNPTAWLFTVTRNLAIDKARRRLRERELQQLFPELTLCGQLNGAHATESRLSEIVACLLHVSNSQATAIVLLHVVFGLSYEEIATISARSPAACRQTGSRALRKCFNAISTNEPHEDAPNVDMYVHAILDASMSPLIDCLNVTSPINMLSGATNDFNSVSEHGSINAGRTRQMLVLTPTGVQWALVLDSMVLCEYHGNSRRLNYS